MGFRVVRTQPDRLAKRRRDSSLLAPVAAEQQAEHVVRLRPLASAVGRGGRQRVPKSRRWRRSQSGAGSDGGGRFSPASNCPSALSSSPRAQIRDAEIDVDGGGRRQQRDRALQARRARRAGRRARAAPFRETRGSRRPPDPAARSRCSSATARSFVAAVPQRDAEIVVRLGGVGLERDRALQVSGRRPAGRPAGRE